MENNSSTLVDELESGEFLSGIIENDLEMNNLLLETDFVLKAAESDLKATIKEESAVVSEDDSSSALSIEVSEDIFKGLTTDLNFSPVIRYASSNENAEKEPTSFDISENLNNLLDDFNETLKSYNQVFQASDKSTYSNLNNVDDDNDKTIVPNENIETKSLDSNKSVQIIPSVTLDSDEEHDYLFLDILNSTLEITVSVEDKNVNFTPVESKLNHQSHFQGCSQDFDCENVGNDFTVILNNEICNADKQISPYLLVSEDPNVENLQDGCSGEDSNTGCTAENEADKEPKIYKDDMLSSVSDYNIDIEKKLESCSTKKNLEFASADQNEADIADEVTCFSLEPSENIPQIDLANDGINFPSLNVYDEAEFERNVDYQNIPFESNDYKNISNEEIENSDMNVTFQNFMQAECNQLENTCTENSEINSPNATIIEDKGFSQNIITLENTERPANKSEVLLNENNNVVEKNFKRCGEELETESKKLKLENPEAVTIETQAEPKKTEDKDAEVTSGEINFTQAIFDAQETADHNDPKWSALKDLETTEDYFASVRKQWHSLALPNPHKNNTTRYVAENIANKIKPQTVTSSKNEPLMRVDFYLEKRKQNISHEISFFNAKLNCGPRLKTRAERNRIYAELDRLRHLKHEVEKNQEELKHINMFYINDSQGWNANFLTQSELQEMQEQDRVIEHMKKVYKS